MEDCSGIQGVNRGLEAFFEFDIVVDIKECNGHKC